MSEIYAHLFEKVDLRLAEAETVGFGFEVPQSPSKKLVVAPIAPKVGDELYEEVAVSV